MLLVLIFGLVSVSASDHSAESVQATDESANSVGTENTLNTTQSTSGNAELSNEIEILGAENDESYSSSESDEVLTAADGTFTDLYNKVKNGGTVTLDRNYVYTASTDSAYVNGITISATTTINGNGFTINGNNVARIFQITGSNVVL